MSTNTPAHIDDIITICHNLRQLINQVHASTDPQHKQMLRTQGLAMMAKLKRLNRDSYFYSRDVKLKMADAQALSEKQHLELQNLLYEKAKLEEEIRKYQKREYLYTSVDMYSLEEFKQRAPSELQTATDEHTLMLNRLEFELRERTRLKEIRDKLIQRRDELIQENKARNEELRKIDTQFEAFVKSAEPVMKSLGMHPEEQQEQDTSKEMDVEIAEDENVAPTSA